MSFIQKLDEPEREALEKLWKPYGITFGIFHFISDCKKLRTSAGKKRDKGYFQEKSSRFEY